MLSARRDDRRHGRRPLGLDSDQVAARLEVEGETARLILDINYLGYASLRQQIDFRFTEPKFLGRDLRAGFDLFHSRYDLSQYSSYDYRSTGGGLRLSYPLNAYTLLSTRYFLKSDEIIVPQGYCNGSGSQGRQRRHFEQRALLQIGHVDSL